MAMISAFIAILDKLVCQRAKALEEEMILAKAVDQSDLSRRQKQLEELRHQRFSMFS